MIKSKKALAAEAVNIIIGVLFIGIAFILFISINSRISSSKSQDVYDVQVVDAVSSYSGLLLMLDKSSYIVFNAMLIDERSDDNSIFNKNSIKIYSTFNGELTKHKVSAKEIKQYVTPTYIRLLSLYFFPKNTYRIIFHSKFGNSIFYWNQKLSECSSDFFYIFSDGQKNSCNFEEDW